MGILKTIGSWFVGRPSKEITKNNPVATAVANAPNVKIKKPRKKAVKKSAAVEVYDAKNGKVAKYDPNEIPLETYTTRRLPENTVGTKVTKLPKGKALPELKKAKNAKAVVEGNAKLLYTDKEWERNFLTDKVTVIGAGGSACGSGGGGGKATGSSFGGAAGPTKAKKKTNKKGK